MKRIVPMMLVAVFFLMSTMDAEAQRKRKRRTAENENREETVSSPRLYQEIKFGNILIQNGVALGGMYSLGFKIDDRFSFNLSPRFRYTFLNDFGSANDFHLFDWGIVPGVRAKITETIYLQGQYGYHSVDIEYRGVTGDTLRKWGPQIGGGQVSGRGPWKFGFEIMLHLDTELQDEFNVIDYWASFSYNF